jgi:hypothetical protein
VSALVVYRVTAGTFSRLYFTKQYAEQMAATLRSYGLMPTVESVIVPDDPLTRLTVSSGR